MLMHWLQRTSMKKLLGACTKRFNLWVCLRSAAVGWSRSLSGCSTAHTHAPGRSERRANFDHLARGTRRPGALATSSGARYAPPSVCF